VPIIDDDQAESDETFTGILTVVPGQPGQPDVMVGNPDQTTITIIDNDVVPANFSKCKLLVCSLAL